MHVHMIIQTWARMNMKMGGGFPRDVGCHLWKIIMKTSENIIYQYQFKFGRLAMNSPYLLFEHEPSLHFPETVYESGQLLVVSLFSMYHVGASQNNNVNLGKNDRPIS